MAHLILHQVEAYLVAVIKINLKINHKSVVDYLGKMRPRVQQLEDLSLVEELI